MTRSYEGVSLRLTVENLRPFYPRSARRRAPGARERPPGAALAAREGARSRRLGPARRLSRAGRDPGSLDSPAPRRQGRRARTVAPGAARHLERPRPASRRMAARHLLPRARAARRRPGDSRGHGVASRRRVAPHGVRPRGDRPRRPRAPARKALVHEPGLRAGSPHVHDLGAARPLHRRARPRGLGHEPPARARPPRAARGHGRAAPARAERGTSGHGLPLPLGGACDYRSVRGAPTAYPFGVKRLVLVLALLAALAPSAAAQEKRPWLWQCEQIGRLDAQWNCYVRVLLEDIDRSGNPARELPRIDRRARAADTSLTGNCHALMHEVGRRYGAEHHVTLGDLMRFIPQSNDPTCSAGFGMGLVMYLGPQIIVSGGRTALVQCMRLPTRYRSYTCVHGIGHALMRGYHGRLQQAVEACRRLGRQGPDCAQGAFHDYWISLRGADGTVRRAHGASPRLLCNGHLGYVRPCWYRYFVEQALAPIIDGAPAIRKACTGLRRLQRYGCVSAAALAI